MSARPACPRFSVNVVVTCCQRSALSAVGSGPVGRHNKGGYVHHIVMVMECLQRSGQRKKEKKPTACPIHHTASFLRAFLHAFLATLPPSRRFPTRETQSKSLTMYLNPLGSISSMRALTFCLSAASSIAGCSAAACRCLHGPRCSRPSRKPHHRPARHPPRRCPSSTGSYGPCRSRPTSHWRTSSQGAAVRCGHGREGREGEDVLCGHRDEAGLR